MPIVQIGGFQLLTILVNMVFGKSIGYSSGIMSRRVGQDAWISMIFAFLIGLVIISVIVWLARRFPKEQPTTYLPKLIGRPLAVVAMLLLAVFFLGSYVTSAITMDQHLNDYLMTETPFIVFALIYTLAIAIGVYYGLEVTARLSVIAFFLVVLMDLLLVAGSIRHFHAMRLLPLFDHGVLPTVAASAGAAPDVAMATTVALMILPLAGPKKEWMRLAWWGLALGLVVSGLWTVFEMGVLGDEVTSQYLISCMQMARAAELSIYLHRYELLMVLLWAYSVITQSVICLYSATELLREGLPFGLGRKIGRVPMIIGLSVIGAFLQYYLGADRDLYGQFLATVWPRVVIPIAYGLPLLFAVVALFRTRGHGPAAQQAEQG